MDHTNHFLHSLTTNYLTKFYPLIYQLAQYLVAHRWGILEWIDCFGLLRWQMRNDEFCDTVGKEVQWFYRRYGLDQLRSVRDLLV